MLRIFTILSRPDQKSSLKFILSFFRFNDNSVEINSLRKELEESNKKIENLMKMINILTTFEKIMSKDMQTLASHIALIEISMVEKNKASSFLKKRTSDDTIN